MIPWSEFLRFLWLQWIKSIYTVVIDITNCEIYIIIFLMNFFYIGNLKKKDKTLFNIHKLRLFIREKEF